MNNNNTKKDLEEEMYEYIDVLADAALQRNPKEYERAKQTAACIYDIIGTLKKHNIKKLEDTVHILASIVIIPIQMLEPDLKERKRLMRELSEAFVKDIFMTYMKDSEMQGLEVGQELDKIRSMASKTYGGNIPKK